MDYHRVCWDVVCIFASSVADENDIQLDDGAEMIWKIPALLATCALGAWLGLMIGDREMPVTVLNLRADTQSVKPGESFQAHYQFYRTRECFSNIQRMLFTSTNKRFVLPDFTFPPGSLPLGSDWVDVTVNIPKQVDHGQTIYRTVGCYECNPLAHIFPVCGPSRDITFWIE